MNRIDRFFLRVDRYSDLTQSVGFAGFVALLWIAVGLFAVAAYGVMR